MADGTTLTTAVDGETLILLDKIAAAHGQSRERAIAVAIERYAREEAEFIDFVQEGIDDFEAGRVHTQEEVEAMFAVRREPREAA